MTSDMYMSAQTMLILVTVATNVVNCPMSTGQVKYAKSLLTKQEILKASIATLTTMTSLARKKYTMRLIRMTSIRMILNKIPWKSQKGLTAARFPNSRTLSASNL